MEVLQRRNKPSSPCTDIDSHGLYETLNRTVEKLGCTPIHWELPSSLPHCMKKEKNISTEQILAELENLMEYANPCRSINDVKLEYNLDNSIHGCKNDNKTFHITAKYNAFLFKEMRTVRSYTAWNLISNIGVVIGLFLGVSLINVPELVKGLWNKISSNRGVRSRQNNVAEPKISIDQIIDMIYFVCRKSHKLEGGNLH